MASVAESSNHSSGAVNDSSATSSRFLSSDLCALLDKYLTSDQVKKIYNAYLFRANAHEGQTRLTGEPYIYHPLSVARVLAEMPYGCANHPSRNSA